MLIDLVGLDTAREAATAERIAAEIATLRGIIETAERNLPTLVEQHNAAWGEYSKGEEIDTVAQKAYDRAGYMLTAAVDTIRMAVVQIINLEDPRYEPTNPRRRTMSDDTKKMLREKKAPKVTAQMQGFPTAYLGDGGNFKVGLDARAKSDLVCAALGLPTDKALHWFSVDEATALLEARGWLRYLEKKRESLTADASRKAKRTREKKTEETQENAPSDVATVVTTREAKPDPKPAPKVRSARGFKTR